MSVSFELVSNNENINDSEDVNSIITNEMIQKNLIVAMKKIIEEDQQEDDGSCSCMGPAPKLEAVSNVVDTLLTLTTLLIGFTAGTYMMFGYEGMEEIESRWGNWCIGNNSVGIVLQEYDWCSASRPLSHEFFSKSYWSFVLLGISCCICFAIKLATFIVQISNDDPSGPKWRKLWYIFMFPIIICFLLTTVGLGLFMLANTLIVRMIYPDYGIFSQYIQNGSLTTVWLSSQYIMGGATGFVGVLSIPVLIASFAIGKQLK